MSTPIPKAFLWVDAMCYHAALQNYQSAMDYLKLIGKAEEKVQELETSIEILRETAENEGWKPYSIEKFERLAIKIECAENETGAAYGPYLQALATTQLLCVAALESHINIKASVLLEGKTRDFLEHISLEEKWLIFPRLIGASSFSPGRQPYQSFVQLVSYRDKLVHYQTREEDWKTKGSTTPSFLKMLGLTQGAAHESLSTVRKMITKLALILEEEIPLWLKADEISYFGLRISND